MSNKCPFLLHIRAFQGQKITCPQLRWIHKGAIITSFMSHVSQASHSSITFAPEPRLVLALYQLEYGGSDTT